MTAKTCTKCGETKALDEFYNYSKTSKMRRPDCKACVRGRSKSWAANNAEQAKANNRRWKIENQDRCNLARKNWIERNPDKYLQTKRNWRARNLERAQEMVRVHARLHPEQARAKQHRRRARKKQNGIYEILPKELKRLYASNCVFCGSNEQITADHIVPINRGGRHSIGNLQPLCFKCNSAKRDRLMVEWRRQRAS